MGICDKPLVDRRLLAWDPTNPMSDEEQAENWLLNAGIDEINSLRGIQGDPLFEKVPRLNRPDDEKFVEGAYASGIRIGRDRLNDASHRDPQTNRKINLPFGGGLGMQGATAASMVDVYAGLDSWHTSDGIVPEDPVNPHFQRDAARVYVSALSNADELFQLPDGTIGNIKAKSAVVAKADSIRIHGREGVKIVTGIDPKNSRGCELISPVPNINLMAGDVDEDDMEPIPKGYKLQAALNDIIDQINQLSGIVDSFLQFQTKFNNIVMSHNHPSPTSIGLGSLATGNPLAICDGSTLQCYDLMVGGVEAGVCAQLTKKDLLFNTAANEGIKIKRGALFSSDQINSRHVYTS